MATFDELYDGEIRRQCTFALYAAEDLETSLSVRGHPRVWFDLQNLVAAAANLSILLWPSDSVHGEAMRSRLKVDGSPIKSSALRDYHHHFEERMLEWKEHRGDRVFVDVNIGVVADTTSQYIFRNFDPSSYEFIFQGEVYYLRALIDSIRVIHRILS